jgi:hypothetical protein
MPSLIETKCSECGHGLLITPEYGLTWWKCYECDKELTEGENQ